MSIFFFFATFWEDYQGHGADLYLSINFLLTLLKTRVGLVYQIQRQLVKNERERVITEVLLRQEGS